MKGTTISKLKQHVAEADLRQVGFAIKDRPNTYWRVALRDHVKTGAQIIIPLEPCEHGERIIQYNAGGTAPEDMDPEYIEDLVARGWVEEIEK